MKYRKSARYVNYRKRFSALNGLERTRAQRFRETAIVALIGSRKFNDVRMFNIARVAYICYLQIMLDTTQSICRPLRWHNSFDSFTESDCWAFFVTQKSDLLRLKNALRIPDMITLENRSVMSGEEVLMRSMYELVSGEDQHNIAVNVFGRDFSQQGRSVKWFVHHLYDNFLDLLIDNLEWWFQNGFMEESRKAIEKKMASLGVIFANDTFRVSSFIDCNCLETSCPGGGPSEGGANAVRWDDTIQRAFYNGWKSIHGLKHQTVDIAHGMTIHMYGPTSLRRNDLKLLGQSGVNSKFRELQVGSQLQVMMFGDSAYPCLSHLSSYHRNEVNTARQIAENKALKAMRISIEWNYMVTSSLFKFLRNLDKLRLLGSEKVFRIYSICTILRNCHVALYGSQSSSYFGLELPEDMLERYMQV